MNELQIRLTADIAQLQRALTKAKNTIKSFESDTAKESERGNVGFKRKIGLIEQLTNKSKQLRVALSQATNEKQVEQYNQELEQTAKEMARLNALGRQVSGSLGSVGGGFGQISRAGANATGVTQEFNRVIQDAPFGLMGVGNNLQQLAGNFAQLSRQAGGTGAAVKASLSAMISPVNLALLAVSALTAGFTAYQMGAFDGLLATRDFAKELDDYKESLDSVSNSILEARNSSDKEIITLNSLRSIIDDETTSREQKLDAAERMQKLYPSIFGNMDKEKILTGDLSKSYEQLTKMILARAQAEASIGGLVDLAEEERLIMQKTADDRAKIAKEEELLNKFRAEGQNELATIQENGVNFLKRELAPELERLNEIESERTRLTQSVTDNLKEANALINDSGKAAEKIVDEFKELRELGLKIQTEFDIQFDKDRSPGETAKRIEKALTPDKPVDIPIEVNFIPEETVSMGGGAIQELEGLLKNYQSIVDSSFDTEVISQYNLKIQETQEALRLLREVGTEEMTSFADILGESFMSLGNQIAQSTGLAKTGWEGFARIILTNAPKIVQAIIASAKAQKVAANIANQANLSQATGNALVGATQSANSLGPLAAYALPVLIAGAVALISGAFSGIGGGGGGVPVASGAPPQIFTNKNTITPPSATNPNYDGSGNGYDYGNEQGRLTVDLDIDTLRFALDMNKEKKQVGG